MEKLARLLVANLIGVPVERVEIHRNPNATMEKARVVFWLTGGTLTSEGGKPQPIFLWIGGGSDLFDAVRDCRAHGRAMTRGWA